MARVGQQAPAFETLALVGDEFKTLKLTDYKGISYFFDLYIFLSFLLILYYRKILSTFLLSFGYVFSSSFYFSRIVLMFFY